MICFLTLSLEKGINEKEFVEDIVGRRAVLCVWPGNILYTISHIHTNTHTTNRLKYAKLVTCQYNKMPSIFLLVFVRLEPSGRLKPLTAHNIYVNDT